eukprot:gene5525-9342_t
MNPVLIIVAILILLIVLYVIKLSLFKKTTKKDTLLLLGTANTGKTALFFKLKAGSLFKTYTSTKVNDEVFELQKNKEEKDMKYHVVDIPGHQSIRKNQLKHFIGITKSIVFLIDSFDVMSNQNEVAEYIYDLFTNEVVVKNRIPILFVCNKMDIAILKSDAIKKQLQSEIEKIRKTRKAQPDSIDGTEVNELDILEGEKFNFDKHSPVEFKFLDVSVAKSKNYDVLYSEILKSLQ